MLEKMDKKKLLTIQTKLNAPKNQRNNFGWFNYRSCEDILTAVKPLLEETNTVLVLDDDVVIRWDNAIDWESIIRQRFYMKATATLYDAETWEVIASASALAREQDDKKGMDQSQISGASSSYARKYALNWLFCIDDNKDADSMAPSLNSVQDILSAISNCKTSVALSQLAGAITQIKSTASQEEFDEIKTAYNAKLKTLK